jgi:hypothetical protein
MLTAAKLALRITSDAYDPEIVDLIKAAKLDLKGSGVAVIDDEDPLIKRAIIIYTKANFGLANLEAEQYQRSYDRLKTHLALSADYNYAPQGV